MKNEAIFLHAKLDGFSWGEKPYSDDFINTQNKIRPVYYVYEGREWDIRYENNMYNLYMNNEKYSSNIFLVGGVYKLNHLSFRQGCEIEFDKSWKCLSVTYYTKKNNKEEFVAKYIVE